MQRDKAAYFWDISEAIRSIEDFVGDFDSVAYAENELLHSAVERKFEIIGEAVSQLAKHFPDTASQLPNYRQIIGFRNILIHGYADIDHARVWDVIHKDVPSLKKAIESFAKL